MRGVICFIETDDERAPFSFFNNLYWRKGIDTETEEGKKIMQHETIHILQFHSYDRLLLQIVCSLFWINPFFWWVQKELSVIHEFLADEKSFEPGDSFHFAKMLLSSYNHGSYLNPDIGFGKSDISRRIAMIESSEKKQSIWKRSLTSIVLLLAMVCILFVNAYPTSSNKESQKIEQQHHQKLIDERISLKRSP
ncbi:MAG: hypothetical protein JST87_05535 [Bacteroidetes bacterium]|nr:hypothetical protein [Bacteroidota bacterium]